MKPKADQCEYCRTDISSEPCVFANYKTTIDGKELIFCCSSCAQRVKKRAIEPK
jgi:YHS domain-containing protein